MAFIDYRLSTSNKKFVVIPFRCCSNDQPVYVLASTNGWTAVEMAKVDTVDSDKRVYLYEHTVILPDDVSNIQYKFRVGENLYLHDESENASKCNTINETRKPYLPLLAPDGFGGLNNTFEACWDPIYSISTHEPNPEPELSTTETPSGPDSLQVSEEETAPARNSQTPPVDLPAANNQELHSAPDSVLQAPKTLEAELVPTTPEANTEPEPEGSGYIRLEKVRTTSLDAIIMQIERSLEERTTKTELRKLCIDIVKDAVRHRTLAERLYGPSKPYKAI